MYNLHPVYIQYFLQVLSQLYFTSTAPNKDQQKEQLLCSPVVLVYNSETSMSATLNVSEKLMYLRIHTQYNLYRLVHPELLAKVWQRRGERVFWVLVEPNLV